MSENHQRYFVITGGPGSGKTTLIEALRAVGRATSVEAGRRIIQDQLSIGGRALPWTDPLLFAELMLAHDIQEYRRLEQNVDGPVFFDRGVADVVGYLRLTGVPVPEHMTMAIERYRYNPRVFICPPWPEIFAQDAERKQTVEEAERTYDEMMRVYGDSGYELIELPRVSVGERRDFVIRASAS